MEQICLFFYLHMKLKLICMCFEAKNKRHTKKIIHCKKRLIALVISYNGRIRSADKNAYI